MNATKIFLIASIIMVSISSIALAHKVNLFAYAEDGMVYTESYFSDGKKVVNSTIEVFDAENNKLLLTGKTDDNGEFSFRIPQATGLRIVLTASMGHKNEYLLAEDEVKGAFSRGKPSVKALPESAKEEKKEAAPESVTQVSDRQLEAIVEQVVERKTAPIMKKLTKIEEQMQKPSLQEILGGVGYILGLMGIGIYFRYKSKH
jgi:nickel transport protein